jgi:ankyrin repeat protein
MISLLLQYGADPNRQETLHNVGATPLHEAACHGQLDGLGLLLDAGADPTVRDSRFESTPAGWAEHFGQSAAVALLERR